jgi:hypothetical protein
MGTRPVEHPSAPFSDASTRFWLFASRGLVSTETATGVTPRPMSEARPAKESNPPLNKATTSPPGELSKRKRTRSALRSGASRGTNSMVHSSSVSHLRRETNSSCVAASDQEGTSRTPMRRCIRRDHESPDLLALGRLSARSTR